MVLLCVIGSLIVVLWGLLVYGWGVYPLLLASRPSRKIKPPEGTDSIRSPSVSVILSAYNEAGNIRERLMNLLEFKLPGSGIEIHVGTDGCTDATARIAAEVAAGDVRVRVHEFPVNRGKVAVLKDLVKRSGGELLVFTDANTHFAPDVMDRMLPWFVDPSVGGVCGRLDLVSSARSADSAEGTYWGLETRLKVAESDIDSCLGANGALYVIRRELFWNEIPDNTIIDDFVIGMKVRERGFRMLYEPRALATEELPEVGAEWKRRVRIGAGDFQALGLCRACLSPRMGAFAWMFWSHKVLRWFTPHALLALCGLSLAGSCMQPVCTSAFMVSAVSFGLLTALLLAAGLGRMAQGVRLPCGRLLRLCDHFVTMQAALFAGFLRYCRGGLKGSWARTPR